MSVLLTSPFHTHLSPTARSLEAREEMRSLQAQAAATMVLWAPDTAGLWSAVTMH